jgi:hypothetical protein
MTENISEVSAWLSVALSIRCFIAGADYILSASTIGLDSMCEDTLSGK